MKMYKLELGFKGARKYIQGPDIFNQVMRCVPEFLVGSVSDIEFVIHRMTGSNLEAQLHVSEKVLLAEPDDVAIIRVVISGQQLQARVKPTGGQPSIRVPYVESAVTDHCAVDVGDRTIRLVRDGSGFSPVEILISMNKALHLAVLNKPDDTSWVFCRWDGHVWPLPADLSGVTVSLKQTLGTRLTRSDVELDGQVLGQIYFSAKGTS
ncbi:hypothetical protein SAMN05216185_103166 [Pseudomonas guariconensis]|uniref:hypothetical protein n=1 Tax=Pseudomonas guariconensis TaxID=1288410 RepID=UPI00088FAEFF|nr:hypothetical protein [Pseudomonas guariconensis]SDC54303.1 hypothetical protein SAMN05216185_103166 [Pseudomonas guariconensis]